MFIMEVLVFVVLLGLFVIKVYKEEVVAAGHFECLPMPFIEFCFAISESDVKYLDIAAAYWRLQSALRYMFCINFDKYKSEVFSFCCRGIEKHIVYLKCSSIEVHDSVRGGNFASYLTRRYGIEMGGYLVLDLLPDIKG